MNSLTNYRIFGFCFIVIGILMYRRGYSGKWGVDVPLETSLLFCSVGACLLVYSFLPKVREKANQKDEYYKTAEMICKECGSKFKEKYVQVKICPKCNGELINIKGKSAT